MIKETLKIIRSVSDVDEDVYIEFYASVYNQKSKPFFCKHTNKNIVEVMVDGAFDDVLKNPELDCKATVFHDKTKIIGRTSAGTLTLSSDDYGLLARVRMGNTQLHQDTIEQIERGDLFECSFIAPTNDYDYKIEDNQTVRYVNSVQHLTDVSIVDEGQYKNTIIMKRDMEDINKEQVKETKELIELKYEEKVEDTDDVKEKAEDKTEEQPEKKEEKVDETDKEENSKQVELKNEKKEEIIELKNDKKEEDINMINNENKNVDNIELVRNFLNDTTQNGTIMLERAGELTTTVADNSIVRKPEDISIVGKELVFNSLNCDYHNNAVGYIPLPYKSPAVGQAVAELASVTQDTIDMNGNILTPKSFQYQFKYSLETVAAAGDAFVQKLIDDGVKGAYRAFEKSVFDKLIAGATTVTGTNTYTMENLDLIEEEIDSTNDLTFLSTKKSYGKAKRIKLDDGSGLFYAKNGKTHGESKWIYSTNFVNPTNEEYVVCGDLKEGLAIADYNQKMIVKDFTSEPGQCIVTVIIMMDSALKNPTLIYKSEDLDPTA
ncbi:HK97 family phage prohead protease [Carboxylicivirga sp. RSCT41]|uniref:HK97 family phage prohead protease n=1 Tax=Carboxylicivirga agarovorans TaxID=3417570 RepID=UPI003D33D2E7